MSKSLTAKLKDDGYNSDSDEEGVDTHVIKALTDYYAQKGTGIPVWLGGTGTVQRTQATMNRSGSRDNVAHLTGDGASRTGKVSLKGIYEQAAERTANLQTSPRRGLSRTGSSYRDNVPAENTGSRRSEDSTHSNASSRMAAPQMSAGERFREKMKTHRTMSSQSSVAGSDTLSQQQTRSSRGSLEVPRDGAAMASRLKRGGLPSNPSANRF